MRIRAVALSPEDFDAWVANQQKPAVTPADDAAKAGQDTFTARGRSSCHAINGVSDPKDVPLVAGAAPNLTHLMSRTTFVERPTT